jgi:hypothetical protein
MARRHAKSPVPESQQMRALSRLLEKPKNGDVQVQEFCTTVVADQKKFSELLAKRKLQA